MNKLKSFLPDALVIIFFIAISLLYFFRPVTEGLVIQGHDHTGGVGAGVEMQEYYQRTGERTRWTNVLFSGMPTYQMSPSYDSTDTLVGLQRLYQLGLPAFAMYVFILLAGFHILLRAFGFRAGMAAAGAVMWAFSSYFFIITGAGHIWKLMALAYIPPTVAGMVLCYRGRYLWGGLVTAFFLALQILSNHIQMSYYFLMVMALMALAFLITAIREGKTARWLAATGVLAVAALIGLGINLSNLYHTYQYSKESMRSKSELTGRHAEDPSNQTGGGLDRDYITQWSYGTGETWSLLVPNVKGGASVPLTQSRKAMEKADAQYMPVYQALGQYWGEQPGTSGPVYVGAFVLMLFVLGLFIVKGPMKWCLLAATVLSVMLAWGRNMMWFTDLFLDYVPMYDRFRTVASILVVAEFTIPLLAVMALREMTERPDTTGGRLKAVYAAYALTGGVALLFALVPDVFFGHYVSSAETEMLRDAVDRGYIPSGMLGGIMENLQEMRRAVFVADAWRSFFVASAGLLLLLAFNARKIKAGVLVAAVLALCLADLWQVDKRYLNDGMFSRPVQKTESPIVKTPADEMILQDPDKDYRVLNLTTNTFNENNTSYYHKSVGGYHPAKLRRYQEMIEAHIAPEMGAFARAAAQCRGDLTKVDGDTLFPVLDMLNVKYVIMGQQGGQTFPVPNPHANGNGWFVERVDYVADADAEIAAVGATDLKRVAVVDNRFKGALEGGKALPAADTAASVRLTHYDANALAYEVDSKSGGVVVFSEIYYPGWQATVDGRPVEIARADYILRAIRVEPGRHKVEFVFDPQSLHTTEAIANSALVLLMVLFLVLAGRALWRRRRADGAASGQQAG